MNEINKRKREILKESSFLFDGILVGILAAVVGIIYRLMITYSENVVKKFLVIISTNKFNIIYLIIFLSIVGFLSGYMVKKSPHSSGSGIPQVSAEVTGRLNQKPISVLISKMFGGFFASLGGLSLGREGPSIQLGAMCGKIISKILKRDSIKETYLLTSGASAGLSVAFNAPLAGVMFSLEEVHKNISKKLVISCFSSAIVSDIIAQYVFGLDAIFTFPNLSEIKLYVYFYMAILGVILGFFGTFYNVLMKICIKIYNKISLNVLIRPQIAMFLSLIMFLFFPIVLGSGHNLVEKLIYTSYGLIFLIILYFVKTFFSLMSFASGVAGGIFLPILVQGAILGAIFSNFVDKENIAVFIIISMAGYLTAVVRSPLTSMILIFEMTQKLSYFLPLGICCLLAYYTANILGTKPVYEYLLLNLLKKNKIKFDGENEIEFELIIENDSKLINKKIKDIMWGEKVFISEIERNGKHIIPKGNTILHLNDKLVIETTREKAGTFVEKFLEGKE
ncbi:ClC family H(+)/Cl(-) exchange transporter [Gemelliphila asaccharolytica]|uniref:Chloride transporter, ClC family n=1 Tax=Gemelliphila asaccharolytica TaxID=502393 RepID=A0ABR5TNM6_9BACL|nr:ClC family H(+)/Cl(-) exchange transporter [Gemella asaccharolytica]KXB59035.1 chloride transporter, ClC family [Gemella asaccharolytica]